MVYRKEYNPKIENSQTSRGLIQVTNACKTYQTASGGVDALEKVSFYVQRGEFVGIIGKSGAGKSTLVNMLSGVDKLTSGSIIVGDVSVHDLNENQRNAWRGRHIGIVYQSFELLNQMTILDNVMLPMDFCGLYQRGKSKERAMDLLRQVEIEKHAMKLPTVISGGQKQRVAIARALANDPEIIVADEPTGNLDSQTATTIMNLFQSLQQQGKTIIMVTHNHGLMPYFTQVYQLTDGVLGTWKRRGRN